MELKDVKIKDLVEEVKSRYDHVIIYLIKDGEGGIHHRTWKGNYLACIAMCTVIQSFVLKAYEATIILISKEEKEP